jgi:DNA-binding beta-propeller fold protein YncE
LRKLFIAIAGAAIASAASVGTTAAQSHTIVALSHRNHTVYELDPATGKILHEFVAPDQPHEAAITSDGATIFASVPAAALVQILDAKTFREKGRIETEYFKRPPQARRGREGAPAPPPNTSASPHGMGLNKDNTKLMESGMGDVVVVDLKTMSVAARYKVGTDPFGGGLRVVVR